MKDLRVRSFKPRPLPTRSVSFKFGRLSAQPLVRTPAQSGRERVCTSLPPTPPDVPFGIRRFLKLGCGFSGQAFDKRL